MFTLAVMCTIMINGQLVAVKGQEIVHKDTQGTKYVYFPKFADSMRVHEYDCTYLEDPTAVSRHPERYHPPEAFQPELTAAEAQRWRLEPGTTVMQLIKQRKSSKIRRMLGLAGNK